MFVADGGGGCVFTVGELWVWDVGVFVPCGTRGWFTMLLDGRLGVLGGVTGGCCV